MAGGGAEVSVAAFNEMKNSMAQLVNLAQLQANSVARLEREADVSKLKAQRAKSDKDGKKAGQARLPKGEEIDAVAYYKDLYSKMDVLEMNRKFTARAVNEGFSGGEKKRNEILQMMMLDPQYCILDETDSGLDIDALKIVAKGVNAMRSPDRGILMITHYQRLLDYIEPDYVHVMADGQIVKTGGKELALELEESGYDFLKDGGLVNA